MAQPAFGLLLKYLREDKKLSLRDLSQLSVIDHTYIYRLETGNKSSPSDEILAKLIRALKPSKRESEMLRFLAKYPETYSALVKYVLQDQTINFDEFKYAAGAVFRGSKRPNPSKLIERVRKFIKMLD